MSRFFSEVPQHKTINKYRLTNNSQAKKVSTSSAKRRSDKSVCVSLLLLFQIMNIESRRSSDMATVAVNEEEEEEVVSAIS